MTIDPQVTAEAPQEAQKQATDKEINFARVRKQLEEERYARQLAEQKVAEIEKIYQEKIASKAQADQDHDDDSSDEPYVDHKRLAKKLARFEANLDQKIDKKASEKASQLFEEHKKQQWLKSNPDFYEIMGNAQTFAERDPELAETILSMPDTFERQKLVYKNIKALGLHQKEQPKSTIQDKIDQNRRSPYYQPSGVGAAPYGVVNGGKDYTPTEGKNAYQKMQELKSRLRI